MPICAKMGVSEMRTLPLALMLAGFGCKRAYVAELEAVTGTVDTRVGASNEFVSAERGQRFYIGDVLRTGPSSEARVSLSSRGKLKIKEKSLIRFGKINAKQARVQIAFGSAEIEAGSVEPLTIHTQVGVAVLSPRTRIYIGESETGLTFDVKLGNARVSSEGKYVELVQGEPMLIKLRGQAQTPSPQPGTPKKPEQNEIPKATNTQRQDPDASAVAENGTDVDIVNEMIPKNFDMVMPVGESAVIHDPKPPLKLRFVLNDPCTKPMLEVSKRTAGRPMASPFVDKRANFLMKPGTYFYRVRCEVKVIGKGQVQVLADSGRSELPRIAPQTSLEADGRKYTVLYQNLLPELIFLWNEGPVEPRCRFQLINQKGRHFGTVTSCQKYKVQSGQVTEGVYDWWFETMDNTARHSPKTSLRVAFDNAAPAASLSTLAIDHPKGSKVVIKGVALEDWKVSALGQPLATDEANRFAVELTMPSEQGALPIRFEHPQRGVHYYLRRGR